MNNQMRIIPILILSASIIQTSYSQTKSVAELLVKEWQIDGDAMRQIFKSKLKENPNVDESNIGEAVGAAIEKIEGLSVTFKNDGTYEKKSAKGMSTSSWSLNVEKKEIKITSNTTKETRVLGIKEISDTKLVVESSDGTILAFKSH